MASRKILLRGDKALNKVSRPVTDFNERLHTLLDDMRETLVNANGLGLAAPQVGILRRAVLVINKDDQVLELINPTILKEEGEQDGYEGCLSVPGYYGRIVRPMRVRVRAQDRYGSEFEVEDDGITARCFCHELEHLEGHLFTERADKLYTVEELEEMHAPNAEEEL
jgi:peptide deformylase